MRLKVRAEERVARFFLDNPDESLTISDVCVKFDIKPRHAVVLLSKARRYVQIERVSLYRSKTS